MEGAARHADKVLRARRREARAALGLSTSHIRPHYWAEVSPNGQYLAVKSSGVRQCITPKSKRGTVQTFSKRSRSRILKTFAMIDSEALSRSLFVTLTSGRTTRSAGGAVQTSLLQPPYRDELGQ